MSGREKERERERWTMGRHKPWTSTRNEYLGGHSVPLVRRIGLSCVGEAWYDDGDFGSGRNLTPIDHNEQFHKVIVHVTGTTLNDENVHVSDALVDLDFGLAIGELAQRTTAQRGTQSRRDGFGELRMGGASEHGQCTLTFTEVLRTRSSHIFFRRVFVCVGGWVGGCL